MRVIRGIIVFLFVLTVIELAGYYLISEGMLANEIVQHYKPADLGANTRQINIYSNYQLDQGQKDKYTRVYTQKGATPDNVRFFTDVLAFERYIDLQDNYNYVLDVRFNSVPFAVVEEGENGEGQTAIWQSKYVWCLYRWILVKKEMPAGPAVPERPSLEAFGI